MQHVLEFSRKAKFFCDRATDGLLLQELLSHAMLAALTNDASPTISVPEDDHCVLEHGCAVTCAATQG